MIVPPLKDEKKSGPPGAGALRQDAAAAGGYAPAARPTPITRAMAEAWHATRSDEMRAYRYEPYFSHDQHHFEQDSEYKQGVCGFVCCLFMLLRLQKKAPPFILDFLRIPANKREIKKQQNLLSAHARSRAELGTRLSSEQSINATLNSAIAFLQSRQAGEGKRPLLHTVGEFPPGFQAEAREKVWTLEQQHHARIMQLLPPQSGPLVALLDSYFKRVVRTPDDLPLFMFCCRPRADDAGAGTGTGKARVAHSIALHLGADNPGVFDPNFGWFSLRNAHNDLDLERYFMALHFHYAVDAAYMFQMSLLPVMLPAPGAEKCCVIL